MALSSATKVARAYVLKTAKDLPADVERYVQEGKDSGMDEGQAWAIAWSRYCKYKNPGSDHCKQDPSDYFKGRSAAYRSDTWHDCNGDNILKDWIKASKVYLVKTKEALEELGCTRIDLGDAETSEIEEGVLYYTINFVLPEGKRVEFFLEFSGELEETEVEHSEQLDVDRFKDWYTTEMCIPEIFDTVRISKEGGPVGAMKIIGMIDYIDIEKALEKHLYRDY